MKNKNILYWLPRVLGLVFILFLSLFALDVFGEYKGLDLMFALFMHLLPELILLVLFVFAWKYDLIGALEFLAFAAYFMFVSGFNNPLTWYLFIPGPAIVIAILFSINLLRKK
jgi:hypothetical protein